MKGKTDFTPDELCSLVATPQAQQLGADGDGLPTMNTDLEAPLCRWSGKTSLSIVYRPNAVLAGIDTGPGIKISHIKVNGVQAVLSDNTNDPPFCEVGIDLTDHSDLFVGASVLSSGQGLYQRCDVAKQMATIVFAKIK